MPTNPKPFFADSPIPPRAFVAGLLIGGAAALLIAKAGRFRLRGKLRVARSLHQAKSSLKDAAYGIMEMANDHATRVSRAAQNTAKPYTKAAGKAVDAASEMVDAGARRAHQEIDRFADAIHAAADVYAAKG